MNEDMSVCTRPAGEHRGGMGADFAGWSKEDFAQWLRSLKL